MIALSQPTDWQQRFLDMVPAIRQHARATFSGYTDESRDDAVNEVVASCYVAYAALVKRGKEDLAYPSVLARYAERQFRAGRRVGTKANSRCVYSRTAKKKNDHELRHIGAPAEQTGGWTEMLFDDRRTPVPDQAAFRCDFPEWLGTLTDRDRDIAEALAIGERTKDVSSQFSLPPARVSQLRRELHDGWREFQGEVAVA